MTPRSRRALETIRACVQKDRFLVLPHFALRMDERGLFWPDVLAVIDDPFDVRPAGLDRHARPKWILRGRATDGLLLEFVCLIEASSTGRTIVFITAY